MRTRVFVILVAMLLATQSLCFGDTWDRSGQKVVAEEKSTAKPAAKVEIYVTDWCPYCTKAVKFLKANNVPFVAYDIEKDKEAAARKKELSGRSGVPFAVINGKKIYGYSEEAYARALGIKGRSGQP
jgi:glutaredoxin